MTNEVVAIFGLSLEAKCFREDITGKLIPSVKLKIILKININIMVQSSPLVRSAVLSDEN